MSPRELLAAHRDQVDPIGRPLSDGARSALLHMLGLDEDHAVPWRDHYVADPADAAMAELVTAGLVRRAPTPAFLPGSDAVWTSTEAGRTEAIRLRPRRSRGAERYHAWLRIRDVDADLTFGEYLRRVVREGGA